MPLHVRLFLLLLGVLSVSGAGAAPAPDSPETLYRRGDYVAADAAATRRLEEQRARLGRDHLDVAVSLNDAGRYAAANDDQERAERYYREALSILTKAQASSARIAETKRRLAGVLLGQGLFRESETLCRESVEACTRLFGAEDLRTLESRRVLGQILLEAKGTLAAEPLLREALEGLAKAQGGDRETADLETARTEILLARIARHRASYAEAEELLTHAAAVRRRILGGQHPEVASALEGLAWVAQNRGNFDRARELMVESFEIRSRSLGSEHPVVIRTLAETGAVLTGSTDVVGGRERLEEAESWFRRAEPLYYKVFGPRHALTGALLGELGWNLVLQEKLDEADQLFHRAIEIRREAVGPDDPRIPQILNYQARASYGKGDFAAAESALLNLLEYHARSGKTTREYLSDNEGLGLMRAAQGDFAGAEKYLSEAARLYELLRLRSGAGSARASFWYSPYERLSGVLLELGRKEEAWAAAERLHGLAISDILLTTGERELSRSDRAREDSLASALTDLENRLAASREAATRDPLLRPAADELFQTLLGTEAALNSFQEEIAARYPVTEGRTFPRERIQRTLDETTAIIGWIDAEFGWSNPKGWGYVIRHQNPVQWVSLDVELGPDQSAGWPARTLREWLTAPGRSALGSGGDEDPPAQVRSLWDRRIAPLIPHLSGVENLVVIPSRAVKGVPLEALIDPQGRLLDERFRVHYVPSATIYAWLREKVMERKSGPRQGLLVGDPPFRAEHLTDLDQAESEVTRGSTLASMEPTEFRKALAGDRESLQYLPRLRWSRREIERIAAELPRSDLFVGADATESKLLELARSDRLHQYDVLHLATHALISDQSPEESALVLSQVEASTPGQVPDGKIRATDGLVTGMEVLREWNLDAELVTLSACETAEGYRTGEGTFGLVQAFMAAGARSALVSLWRVDDQATALLMERFYGTWLSPDEAGQKRHTGPSKREALGEARKWLRQFQNDKGERPFQHPFYWAGFILIGDDR